MTDEQNKLGFWTTTIFTVGAVIGSGIFLLPSSLAKYGGISLLGWLFTSAGAIMLALSFSYISKVIPKAGGPYAYTKEMFGSLPGFLIGWGYWMCLLIATTAIAVACVGYLGVFFPGLVTNSLLSGITALLIVYGLTQINVSGVRNSGTIQVIFTILKVMGLLMVIFAMVKIFNRYHFEPFNLSEQSNFSAVTATATMTLWAFLGIECISVLAENVKDPEKNVGRATVLGTIIIAIIYIASTISILGILPQDELMDSTAPFADAATKTYGTWAGYAIAVAAVFSCLGAMNATIAAQAQMPLAMARDKLFPPYFEKLTPQSTPLRSLWVSAILITLLLSLNFTKGLVDLFTQLIMLSTLSILLPYAFTSLSAMVHLYRNPEQYSARQKLVRTVVTTLALAYSIWAIWGAGFRIIGLGFLLLIVSLPIFIYYRTRGNKELITTEEQWPG